jgi:hypothetical protein
VAYHTDLTLDHGVRFIWRGRVTSVIGQGVRRSLQGIFDGKHKLESAITLLKEIVKGILGRIPGSRFRLHANNRVFETVVLRDGRAAFEFLRSSPHPQGVSVADRGDRIYEVLRENMLDLLVERRGTAIIYTHLGKSRFSDRIFPPQTIDALTRLAKRADSGEILVATTARILDYHFLVATLDWSVSESEKRIRIECTTDAETYQGLTFEVSGEKPVDVVVNGELVQVCIEPADGDEPVRCVSIPWEPLAWPL